MNFTPVLDELLICQIASTHHENAEFDHCFSPVAMGDCVIDLTKSLEWSGGCIFPPPPRPASGRVVAGPGVSGRQAATSKSSIAWTNAARSIGARAVTILPSVIAGSSMKGAPAFSRSGLMLHQAVARLPRVSPASDRTHGPWQIAATILPAAAASWTKPIALASPRSVSGFQTPPGTISTA